MVKTIDWLRDGQETCRNSPLVSFRYVMRLIIFGYEKTPEGSFLYNADILLYSPELVNPDSRAELTTGLRLYYSTSYVILTFETILFCPAGSCGTGWVTSPPMTLSIAP